MTKQKEIKKRKKQQQTVEIRSLLADTAKGVEWLKELAESDFRDHVLSDLFARMKAEGEIGDFINIHGRNEHGIDWIIQEPGKFFNRLVGIQVKSRPITRQGDSRSDSSLVVKNQCESAYDNRFTWQGNDVRLDDVQLWTSSHITADAESELTAPYSKHRIPVVKSEKVFALIERFCPNLFTKIPGLAETGYILRMANPDPLPMRLFGIQLNPKKHFLEPKFSRYSELSTGRFFDRKIRKMKEEAPLFLDDIIKSESNVFIIGPELSGKTYLIKRMCCQLAELGHLPVSVDGSDLVEKMPKSISHLLNKHLTWYPLKVIESPEKINRKIYLLVDNADILTEEQISLLYKTAHKKIIIILTGKKSITLSNFRTYYIAGVQFNAVHKFIRSIDKEQLSGNTLLDRTTQYISRTFSTSGLPMNTFTVSMMLAECKLARRHLATPTMGRLIERFVDGQLGSHADSLRVDFETKLQFLTNLGGSNLSSFTMNGFRKRLTKYIAAHGHPHDLREFEQDLLESGLLEKDEDKNLVKWTRTIFQDYFWVRNLVREKKFYAISKRLRCRDTMSVGAIAGSQMGNAHPVLIDLLKDICNESWMKKPKRGTGSLVTTLTGDFLPDDAEEDALLSKMEEDEAKQNDFDENLPSKRKTSQENDPILSTGETTETILSHYTKTMLEEKHYLAQNISSLLINSRSLSRDDKENAVICVLRSNIQMVKHLSAAFLKLGQNKISPLMAATLSRFFGLAVNDTMIGDPFLTDVFRGLKKRLNISFDEQLILTDLLVACGVLPPSSYVDILRNHTDATDVVVVYMRLVNTYFFRFHKEGEKVQLRAAMKAVRKFAKGFSLPPVD
jgi:hypothetical protein